MKNIISRIMILAMLASFAACSSELDNAGGYAGDEAMVRMNFTGLNGFAVTRAVDQTAVEKVTVYLFEGTEESSELKYTLPVTLSDKTEAGLPGSFKVPEGGTYHVEAIANAEMLTGINTYGDFLAQTTTAAFEGNLLMQGAAGVTLTGGQTTTLSMELVRLAATFQVEGAVEAGVSDVAFTLKGAVKESYLVKHADGDSFTIPADAETGENAVPYSYENPENSTVMVITGTMYGAAYRTEVPVVQVLRNHLYTVKLVNNSGTIEPELTVTDWSEISSSLEIGAGSALMMTAATDKTQDPEATVAYPKEGDLKSTQTVNVAADAAATYYLYVKSANIEAALDHTTLPDGWTLEAPVETRTDYLWEKGYWTLTIPANTTAEVRTLTVTATNKLIADATVSITFTQEGVEEETDELQWAENNTRSWIDAVPYNTNIYCHSYIPDIPLADQGIGFVYSDATILLNTENPYAYHFQWDRDFGFVASTAAFDNGYTYLPNSNNIPDSFGPVYGGAYEQGTASQNYSLQHPDMFVYPSNNQSYDWCSTERSVWTDRFDTYGISAAPKGYHIPTVAEWKTLLPEGENITYSYSTGYKVELGTSYPFFAKQEGANTKVWCLYGSSSKNYLEVRIVKGAYSLADLTAEILDNARILVQIPADGYRTSQGTLQWQQRGLYWSSESAGATKKGYSIAFSFTINTGAKTVRVSVGEQPRKYAFSIRCIKDNQ
ncbi:FISUMP domain-containing protein [Bacteroides ndongoniae]|uniref:fimbrial protein n=1 Tax=Bacteroides ndongoniae TaxID=1903262 RepID=UPI0023F8DDD9|nr:FISUMP domain-containing protein [Bacteroides ndongoniae]